MAYSFSSCKSHQVDNILYNLYSSDANIYNFYENSRFICINCKSIKKLNTYSGLGYIDNKLAKHKYLISF